MRPIIKHLYDAAMHPHLSAEDFRLCFVKAVDCRDKSIHETIDAAFQRYTQEAIFAYEREHLAK